jgi:hypothetical protein
MAQTTGLVQYLAVIPSAPVACVRIGPSPANSELLAVNTASGDSAATLAYKSSMIEALATAMVARREVTATHGDSDALISSVVVNTA